MKQPKPPYHPLVDDQPVDTLSHIQSLLSFAQEFTAKATEDAELTPYEIRVHTGLYAILKIVIEALNYEIDRLDYGSRLTIIK